MLALVRQAAVQALMLVPVPQTPTVKAPDCQAAKILQSGMRSRVWPRGGLPCIACSGHQWRGSSVCTHLSGAQGTQCQPLLQGSHVCLQQTAWLLACCCRAAMQQ